MKKTTAIIAVLLSTAVAAPAQANDGVRLGIGVGALIINEMMKGGNNKAGGKRNKDDQLIGRVGEEPAPRNTGSRNRNKVAPTVAAGGAAAAVAYALPEGDKAPIPETKPTPEQMAEYAALQASSSSTPISDEFDEGIPLHDEQGRYWGVVSPDEAEKVDAAVKLGMKPSTVIPEMTGLKLPEAVEPEPKPPTFPTVDVQTAEAAPEKQQEVVPAMPSPDAVVQDTVEVKEPPAAVDATATTASVDPAPKVEEPVTKPVEVKKPKAKVDL